MTAAKQREPRDREGEGERGLDEVRSSEPRTAEEVERLEDDVDEDRAPDGAVEGIEECLAAAVEKEVERLDDYRHEADEHQQVRHEADGDREQAGEHLLERRGGDEEVRLVPRPVVQWSKRPARSDESPDEEREPEAAAIEVPVAESPSVRGERGNQNDSGERAGDHEQGTVAGDEVAPNQQAEPLRGEDFVHVRSSVPRIPVQAPGFVMTALKRSSRSRRWSPALQSLRTVAKPPTAGST